MEAAPAQRQHHHLHRHSHQQQHPPGRACPRCDSTHTKFCYYNNYSLSQPRYFCRGCRRYWTHGGALRNVPVGGGSRKRPRPRPRPTPTPPPPVFNHSSTPAPTLLAPSSTAPCYFPFHGGGFFSSLVALQSMNLPALGIGAFPGALPSSNLGNFFNGFEFGVFDRPDAAVGGWQKGLIGGDVGGIEQKRSVSAELMSPLTGDGAWSTVRGGEDSALKADQWTDFLGGEDDDTDK